MHCLLLSWCFHIIYFVWNFMYYFHFKGAAMLQHGWKLITCETRLSTLNQHLLYTVSWHYNLQFFFVQPILAKTHVLSVKRIFSFFSSSSQNKISSHTRKFKLLILLCYSDGDQHTEFMLKFIFAVKFGTSENFS